MQKLALVLAVMGVCGACASINPIMTYRSDAKVEPTPILVDVRMVTDEVPAGVERLTLETFEKGLEADLSKNGPFGVDSANPDALLEVRVLQYKLSPPDGGGWPVWLIYPLPFLGVPYERTDIAMTVKARLLRATDGQEVASTIVSADDAVYSGMYYNGNVTFEGIAGQLGEQLREDLAQQREVVLAGLGGERRVAVNPVAAPAPEVGGLQTGAPQPTSYALIVGVERYRLADRIPLAEGARYDAQQFEQVALKTLNIPRANVTVLLDDEATRADIRKSLKAIAANATSKSRIYVFFSGHGAPETQFEGGDTTARTYLLPYNGDAADLKETAIAIDELLQLLEEARADEVLVFLDACFSGAGGRSVIPKGTRPLLAVKAPAGLAKVTMFSSSSESEISGPNPDGPGGLFSRYLVEGLGSGKADLDGDGQISLTELSGWVQPRVKRAAEDSKRSQTPTLRLGSRVDGGHFIVAWGLQAR